MTTTVDQLVLLARQRSDMVNSNFLKPSEWISNINYSAKELYDILIAKFEDYYTADPFYFTLAGGVSSQALPADFYKLRGVDRELSAGEYYTVRPFSFEDRNDRRRVNVQRGLYPSVRYRIFGNNIIFNPDDGAEGNYRIWFIPRAKELVAGSDTVDGVNGWEDYIVVDAAIKALVKEESDVSVLMMQKQALLQRINDMANNRDAGETSRIVDVNQGGFASPWYNGGWW